MKYVRLTKKEKLIATTTKGPVYSNIPERDELYNRLAELEDKIENGTLREVPCKVGDTIYFDTYRRGNSIGVQPHKVAMVRFVVGIEPTSETTRTEIQEYEFGKSVFFTAEEAEAKLKKVMEEIK